MIFDLFNLVTEENSASHTEYVAKCPDCGWSGTPGSCNSYEETESWELPWIRYTVFICPDCGSDQVDVEPIEVDDEVSE